jgi:hypothetical protein
VKGTTIMRRTLLLPVAVAALTAAALTGCGSGGGKASTAATSATTTAGSAAPGGSASPPSPGAPETNPAGDIPDNQAYVTYSPAGNAYSVKVPEGWARTSTGSTVAFTDKLNRIEIAPATTASAPTVQSVTSQVVPGLQGKVPQFAQPKVSTASRHAGQAVLLTYRGDTAPDPVTGKVVHDAFERYAFFKGGHEVDLTLSGPVNADNVDPWRIVTDSFRWQ